MEQLIENFRGKILAFAISHWLNWAEWMTHAQQGGTLDQHSFDFYWTTVSDTEKTETESTLLEAFF